MEEGVRGAHICRARAHLRTERRDRWVVRGESEGGSLRAADRVLLGREPGVQRPRVPLHGPQHLWTIVNSVVNPQFSITSILTPDP